MNTILLSSDDFSIVDNIDDTAINQFIESKYSSSCNLSNELKLSCFSLEHCDLIQKPRPPHFDAFTLSNEIQKENMFFFLDQNSVIGCIHCEMNQKNVTLSEFCIRPEYRSNGLGSHIMKFIIKKFDNYSLLLTIHRPQSSQKHYSLILARFLMLYSFYTKHGFRPYPPLSSTQMVGLMLKH